MTRDTYRRRFLKGAGLTVGFSVVGATGGAVEQDAENERDDGTARGGDADGQRPACAPSRPRPGPDALYDQPQSTPQFENTDGWSAEPILVSGTDAYVDGEYLYQGFVYDDYGASTSPGPTPPAPEPDDHNTGPMSGDIVYPTDADRYGHDAADVLEIRARPTDDGVAYRFTLNTMLEPDAAGIALGIDTGAGDRTDWGYGLGELGAAVDHVLVACGGSAELDGRPVDATVDASRNQIHVDVPLDPERETWRHYAVAGVYDTDDDAFVQIQEQPSETEPGGARGQDPPPVFNVGFRFHDQEPMGSSNTSFARLEDDEPFVDAEEGLDEASEATETESRSAGYGHWRDHAQAKALAERDISTFHADIDFEALEREVTRYDVPERGYVNRLYASGADIGAGIDPESNLIEGRVQPYSVYVPSSYDPDEPAPMHLLLHSLTSTYNQYRAYMPRIIEQLGEQRDAIVLTPHSRGPAHWYEGAAELDAFEAWGDAAHRYNVDFDRVTIGGYSMGGYGTYKLASQYPDLFARAFAIVGPPDAEIYGGPSQGLVDSEQNAMRITDNLRTVPLLMWAGTDDELVPYPGVLGYQEQLAEHGYRHRLDTYPTHDHLLFAVQDQWGPGREFLGDASVEREPRRVTYRRVPAMDDPSLGLVHDGAHWVSDIEAAEGAESALVDAVSHARDGEPTASAFERAAVTPSPHQRRGVEWHQSLRQPSIRNELTVTLEGVDEAVLWADDAGLDTARPITIEIEADADATLVVTSDRGTARVDVPEGRSTRSVRLRGHGSSCSGD